MDNYSVSLSKSTPSKSVSFLSVCAMLFVFASMVIAAPSYAGSKKDQPSAATNISSKININTADAKALASSLNGVGLKKAEAIVAWRKANGKFKTAKQLLKVKGIGSQIFETNADKIIL
ncbi:MAG: competence protein ComEA [Flavobacteriales bacterium]|jgi:competence protein ComEA